MFERLSEIGQEIRDLASWIRREVPPPEDAVSLLKEVGAIENTCASLRVLLSGRIAGTPLWQEKGDRSAAHFVARATRTTVSKAVETLEPHSAWTDSQAPLRRSRKGTVSETQVKEIASAASMDPSSEKSLLETARTGDVTALREQCRRVRTAAITDEMERYEAIHGSRYLRSWSDQDGGVSPGRPAHS